MKNFISVPIIHPHNVEGDTVYHISIEDILQIAVATQIDRRQRNEIQCIIFLRNGNGMATSETADKVIQSIREIEKEYPAHD